MKINYCNKCGGIISPIEPESGETISVHLVSDVIFNGEIVAKVCDCSNQKDIQKHGGKEEQ